MCEVNVNGWTAATAPVADARRQHRHRWRDSGGKAAQHEKHERCPKRQVKAAAATVVTTFVGDLKTAPANYKRELPAYNSAGTIDAAMDEAPGAGTGDGNQSKEDQRRRKHLAAASGQQHKRRQRTVEEEEESNKNRNKNKNKKANVVEEDNNDQMQRMANNNDSNHRNRASNYLSSVPVNLSCDNNNTYPESRTQVSITIQQQQQHQLTTVSTAIAGLGNYLANESRRHRSNQSQSQESASIQVPSPFLFGHSNLQQQQQQQQQQQFCYQRLIPQAAGSAHLDLAEAARRQTVEALQFASLHSLSAVASSLQKSGHHLFRHHSFGSLPALTNISQPLIAASRHKLPNGLGAVPAVANQMIAGGPSATRRELRKCRRVYGIERRAMWCTQCRWKKACSRFCDPFNQQPQQHQRPAIGGPTTSAPVNGFR